MATPGEKLAASLEGLRKIQRNGAVAIRTNDISTTHRSRLVKNGFLSEVVKGWFIASDPTSSPGDSTSWFTSYWKFCAEYLSHRFGERYCLSAEQSLLIHAGNMSIPLQLMVRATDANNYNMPMLHGTSMFLVRTGLPNSAEILEKDGLRILSLPSALIESTPSIFLTDPAEVRIALGQITDPSEVLGPLLNGGRSTVAGRLAGAFRNIHRPRMADAIVQRMRALDYDVREKDPFERGTVTELSARERSPYMNRLKLLWAEMRPAVMGLFPPAPGLPVESKSYLARVEELYRTDAYHSLSIERYNVTAELIEKVRSGSWDATGNPNDRKHRDALAARGYYLATLKVRTSLEKVLQGANAGTVADHHHAEWYSALFEPSVSAGICKPSDLAGYRSGPVYISNARHVPPPVEAVRDTMPLLFELLASESEASVRAVLGHFFFVFIHPYMDGNGRMARFLLNVMLASGGYPWTVVPVQMRDVYMEALEQASVNKDITPFADLLAKLVRAGMEGRPMAGPVP